MRRGVDLHYHFGMKIDLLVSAGTSSPTMVFECPQNLKITEHPYSIYFFLACRRHLHRTEGVLQAEPLEACCIWSQLLTNQPEGSCIITYQKKNRDMLFAFAVLWKFESVSVSKYPSLFHDRGSHQKQKLF